MARPTRAELQQALDAEHAASRAAVRIVNALNSGTVPQLEGGWSIATRLFCHQGEVGDGLPPLDTPRTVSVECRLVPPDHRGRLTPPASVALAYAEHLAAIEAWERGEGPWPGGVV